MLELLFYRDPETIYEYEFVTCRCNYKYVVMGFSYFVGLTGCVILGGGIFLHFDPEQIRYLLAESWYPWADLMLKEAHLLPSILDASGVIIYFIGVLGATSSLREDIGKTLLFYVILMAFYSCLLILGTWLFVIQENVNSELQGKLRKSATLFQKDKAAEIWLMYVEDVFECCGGLPFHTSKSYVRTIEHCLPNVKHISCAEIVPRWNTHVLNICGVLTVTYGIFGLMFTAYMWRMLERLTLPE